MDDFDQEQNQSQGPTMSAHIQTIGEHFKALGGVSWETISDGEIDAIDIYGDFGDDEYAERDYDEGTWSHLLEYCEEAVQKTDALPYLGRKTNGGLMVRAMLVLREKHRGDAPPCWYPVAKRLRNDSGPSVLTPETPAA